MKKRFYSVLVIICAVGMMCYYGWLEEQERQQLELARITVEQLRTEEEEAAQAAAIAAAEAKAKAEAEAKAAREAAEKARQEELKQRPYIKKEVDLADLQENINGDIYAWIYIPDSMIDYPVLQHPTDNSYYLNYNIDGSKGYPGCIYTENYNATDFTDPNTVMYGHNMKNGSMFAGLHEYEDAAYFEEHPNVYIYTEEGILEYDIFAAYQYSDLHLLLNFDFKNRTTFKNYIKNIFDYSGNFNKEIEVTADSKILTMSTCVANQGNKRYLVQAVLSEIYPYEP